MTLDLLLWAAQTFLLKHIVLIAIPVAIVLAVFFPTEALAFVRSRVGQIVLAILVAMAIGWELRGFVEGADEARAALAKARADATAAQRATAAATARAALARREALVVRAIADAANTREADARADAESLQETADDYAAELATRPARRCALSAADVGGLRRIGPGAHPRHP